MVPGQGEGEVSEIEAAIVQVNQALEENPKDQKAWNNLGFLFKKMGRTDEAVRAFERAIELKPDYPEAWNNKGDTLFTQGKVREAISCFDRAIEARPNYERAWYNKGAALESMGRDEEALRHLNMVLRISPDHQNAQRLKAKILGKGQEVKRVWLFAASETVWNSKRGREIVWGYDEAAPELGNLRRIAEGDIVLGFSKAPEAEIFGLFEARSWMYIDPGAAKKYLISLEAKFELPKPVPRSALEDITSLKNWPFLATPDEAGDVAEVSKTEWRAVRAAILAANPDLEGDVRELEGRPKMVRVDYHLDTTAITNRLPVSTNTLHQIQTNLRSGKNVLLHGPPGCGKMKLALMVSEQICGRLIDQRGRGQDNFTMRVGGDDWNDREVLGEWSTEGGHAPKFREGFAITAVRRCERSLKIVEKPHYMILHKIERLDVDRVLGKFLSFLNQKEKAIIMSEFGNREEILRVPREFRVIATADVYESVTPANLAPLQGNFAFIEVGLPDPYEERERIPLLVRQRLIEMGLVKGGEETHPESLFLNDPAGVIQLCYDRLLAFVGEEEPEALAEEPEPDEEKPEEERKARGLRTFVTIGTNALVDTMVSVASAVGGYSKESALEDAVLANIIPYLERLDRDQTGEVLLKAIEVFGIHSKVARRIDKMVGRFPAPGTMKVEGEGLGGKGGEPEGPQEVTLVPPPGGFFPGGGPPQEVAGEEEDEEPPEVLTREEEELEVDYSLDLKPIFNELSISMNTVDQIVTNLESGRNIILYGAPGCGKTKVATLICEQLCGKLVEFEAEGEEKAEDEELKERLNYTLLTANAEWGNYEMVGGIAPKVSKKTGGITYGFKDGAVTQAVRKCIHSIKTIKKPHYLIIDEFNRANVDEAFGKLFTVFEYREEQPLLDKSENRGVEMRVPRQFRIIGTMNVQDKNTLFELGHALMRRFAFVEVGLPDKEDEYNRMPHFVRLRLDMIGLPIKRVQNPRSKFDCDPDGQLQQQFERMMKFVEEEPLPEEGEQVPRGVRTYRKIGTAQLIDCLVWTVNAAGNYSKDRAMEDAIIANILPQMENVERSQLINIQLKAIEVLGDRSRVTQTLDRMIKSPVLSVFT